jgi:hypothetical protein
VVREAWSLSEGPSIYESSSISQHYIQSLVDKEVVPMQYSADATLVLWVDESLNHVLSHPIQSMVEEVVISMQSSSNPALVLKSDKSKEVFSPMHSLDDPIPISGSVFLFLYMETLVPPL